MWQKKTVYFSYCAFCLGEPLFVRQIIFIFCLSFCSQIAAEKMVHFSYCAFVWGTPFCQEDHFLVVHFLRKRNRADQLFFVFPLPANLRQTDKKLCPPDKNEAHIYSIHIYFTE
eukprot:GEMP01077152.1.p3 GENE.GEMP01077152.1~~GEMP01077152.1.p3  ORF type:complete len:114 (+),score=0.71 GEMP01077152.1:609-950(+)